MIPPGTATASPRPRSWRRDADEAARRLRAATIDGPQPAASILAARLRADLGELRYRDVVRRAGLELQLALPYAGTGAELMGVEEEHCVREVLRARRLWRYELPTRTSFVARFERDAEILLGVRHVHATVSGSVALQIALLALGVGPGDEVLIPAVTWVGCADAVDPLRRRSGAVRGRRDARPVSRGRRAPDHRAHQGRDGGEPVREPV